MYSNVYNTCVGSQSLNVVPSTITFVPVSEQTHTTNYDWLDDTVGRWRGSLHSLFAERVCTIIVQHFNTYLDSHHFNKSPSFSIVFHHQSSLKSLLKVIFFLIRRCTHKKFIYKSISNDHILPSMHYHIFNCFQF